MTAALRPAVTEDRYCDPPSRDQLDLDSLVGRTGRDSGLGVRGRRGRSTSADHATRSGRDTGLEPVDPQAQSRTGPDTDLELVGRQDQSTPGDRGSRIGRDTGLELVGRLDRSTLGDRRDTAPEVVRTPVTGDRGIVLAYRSSSAAQGTGDRERKPGPLVCRPPGPAPSPGPPESAPE